MAFGSLPSMAGAPRSFTSILDQENELKGWSDEMLISEMQAPSVAGELPTISSRLA